MFERRMALLLTWLTSKLTLAGLLAVCVFGLSSVMYQPARPNAEAEGIEPPGSGVTSRVEATDIWLSSRLAARVRREGIDGERISGERLRDLAREEGAEGLWYAVTRRLHQADGGVSEITMIVEPLAASNRVRPPTAADKRRHLPHEGGGGGGEAPVVHVIPDELLKVPRREAMEVLLKRWRDGAFK
jgi:hypothetical protein